MPFAFVLALGFLGAAYFLSRPPSGGRDWRGFSGTAFLQPGVVYAFEMAAPLSTDPAKDLTKEENQTALTKKLEAQQGKDIHFTLERDGVHVYFQQSFPTLTTITFGKAGIGPALIRTARRVDGLDWDHA